MSDTEFQRATFAGGCFWCLEQPFEELTGVRSVTSGYTGGTTENPTYEEVCSGTTGHAEVVQIEYDPTAVSYEELLEVFFSLHDPTTLDRQGPDVGSQYRSAVFYHDDEQRELAEGFIQELDAAGAFEDPIVTVVEPMETFYEAEEYHQNYFEKNPNDAYCRIHAAPKLEKVRKQFEAKTKPR